MNPFVPNRKMSAEETGFFIIFHFCPKRKKRWGNIRKPFGTLNIMTLENGDTPEPKKCAERRQLIRDLY